MASKREIAISKASVEIDISLCDREPIHIPGRIQPFGCLLCADPETGQIEQASANCDKMLGIGPDEACKLNLREFLGEEIFRQVCDCEDGETPVCLNYVRVPTMGRMAFSLLSSKSSQGIIAELEPILDDDTPISVQEISFCSEKTASLPELLDQVAHGVRKLTGYDRVMIYQFDEHWNGSVVAEARDEKLHPWLGHHYPAGDIPTQAREIFKRNWVRIIPDVRYEPCEIVPAENPRTKGPLDLSVSILRSVSPVHVEYLKNMEVGGSLTISLICNNRLWGLIACHHSTPRHASAALRTICTLVGKSISLRIGRLELKELHRIQGEIAAVMKELERRLETEAVFEGAIDDIGPQLKNLIQSDGLVVLLGDRLFSEGEVPDNSEIVRLRTWLDSRDEETFVRSRLGAEYERADKFADVGSGVLAIKLGGSDYIIWFRREVVREVVWAGDPNKAMTQSDGRLHPRRSFEEWRETMKGTSLSFEHHYVLAADVLREILSDIRVSGSSKKPEMCDAVRNFSERLSMSMRHTAKELVSLDQAQRASGLSQHGWLEAVDETIGGVNAGD